MFLKKKLKDKKEIQLPANKKVTKGDLTPENCTIADLSASGGLEGIR